MVQHFTLLNIDTLQCSALQYRNGCALSSLSRSKLHNTQTDAWACTHMYIQQIPEPKDSVHPPAQKSEDGCSVVWNHDKSGSKPNVLLCVVAAWMGRVAASGRWQQSCNVLQWRWQCNVGRSSISKVYCHANVMSYSVMLGVEVYCRCGNVMSHSVTTAVLGV